MVKRTPAAKQSAAKRAEGPQVLLKSGRSGSPVSVFDPAVVDELLKTQAALLGEVRSLRRELGHSNSRLVRQSRVLDLLMRERNASTALAAAPAAERNRAAVALAAMRERLGITPEASAQALASQPRVSEAVKADWIQSGLLIGSSALSNAWGCSRQALEQACDRNELFSLKISNRRWYPASVLSLSAEDVSQVCVLWSELEPVAKFIAWESKQGSLGGQTIPEALAAGRTEAAVQAAEAVANKLFSADAATA